MQVTMRITATDLSKDDLRALIQAFREWELRTPRSEVVGVVFETNPQLSSDEAKGLFQGIYPPFANLVSIPAKTRQLNLGNRGVVIGGKLVGTVDELSLSIAEATDQEIKSLQEAETISLVKVRRG